MRFRRRLYLSSAEKVGFLLIFIILLLFAAGRYYFSIQDRKIATSLTATGEEQEIDSLCRMLLPSTANSQSRTKETAPVASESFPFNPNTADSSTFVRLGLTPWQARNAIKYRKAGGRWKSAEDFSRLYGLSRETFNRLRPYIRIEPTVENVYSFRDKARQDSLHAKHYTPKYTQGTTLDPNTADTTQLKGIPGIGSYYASKICRYRDALGGFLQTEQLKEIEGLPENIEQWFRLELTPTIRKTNINRSTFKQLVRHPYLNYEQVKAIFSYRQKFGDLKAWKELLLLDEFTEADYRRLHPYIEF